MRLGRILLAQQEQGRGWAHLHHGPWPITVDRGGLQGRAAGPGAVGEWLELGHEVRPVNGEAGRGGRSLDGEAAGPGRGQR